MDDEKAIESHLVRIGQKLRELRQDGDFEGGYVGFAIHHVGMQPKQYWKLEAGTANFTIRTLLKVLAVHKMSLGEFFEGL